MCPEVDGAIGNVKYNFTDLSTSSTLVFGDKSFVQSFANDPYICSLMYFGQCSFSCNNYGVKFLAKLATVYVSSKTGSLH